MILYYILPDFGGGWLLISLENMLKYYIKHKFDKSQELR